MADSTANNIFVTATNSTDHLHHSRILNGRPELITKHIDNEFNSYANWGLFSLYLDPDVTTDGSKIEVKGDTPTAAGMKSLFNNINAVWGKSEFRSHINQPLIDSSESRLAARINTDCSIKALVEASQAGTMGRQLYTYADFMYCKHLGKVSNNYLITLRRFPTPCSDYIGDYLSGESEQNHMPDIGRMVTWLGTPGNDMSSILKYSYNQEFEQKKSEFINDEKDGDAEGGMLAGMMAALDPKYRIQMQQGYSGKNASEFMSKIGAPIGGGQMTPYKGAKWLTHYDDNRYYGDLDQIQQTYIRGTKNGLTFDHNFSLVFDYELRSYNGINGKAAFLDLLGNILATTYVTGKFWGGAYINTSGAHLNDLWAQLPIFKLADKGELGNFDAVSQSLVQSFSSIGEQFKGQFSKPDGSFDIKALGNAGFGMFMGGMLNMLGRPQRQAVSSLLTGAPVGPWHVTIGNPRNPILSMGNMIIDKCEVEHYGPLGLDDFPTGIKVTVTLKHGQPRDASRIEKMYMWGDSRIYFPMNEEIKAMYDKAPNIKTGESDVVYQDGGVDSNLGTQTSTTPNASKTNIYKKFFTVDNMDTIVQASREGGSRGSSSKKKK